MKIESPYVEHNSSSFEFPLDLRECEPLLLNKCSLYASFTYIGICIYSWYLLMSVSYSGISVSPVVAEVSLAFCFAPGSRSEWQLEW